MKRELRVPVEGLMQGRVRLSEDVSRYVVKVRRIQVGELIQLFDPIAAVQARGRLLSDRLPQIEVEITDEPQEAVRQNLAVTLLQGLGKGDKPEQAVRDATVFGAERVIFVDCARSERRGELKKERLLRIAAQVARQCERGDLPELIGPLPLEEAVKHPSISSVGRVVCGWAEDAVPLLDVMNAEELRSSGAAVLIGPEGGLSDEELQRARAGGFQVVSLGPYVLRTEVACTAVLAALRLFASQA